MNSLAKRAGDLWVARYARPSASVKAARADVAHLKPIVVVTGGSRGIGAALAARFAEAGHDVAIVARGDVALNAMAASFRANTSQTVLAIACDITSLSAPAEIAQTLTENGFYLDILVNNAGLGLSGPFDAHTSAEIDQLIALNVAAFSRLMQHALVAMRARQQGGILNVASLGAAVPGPFQAAYYASKSYVTALTEAVAAEKPGDGVRISVLNPGPVNTTFHASMKADNARYWRFLPALSPERVARAGYRGFTVCRRVIVPGIFNRVMFGGVRLLPHPVTIPIVRWLLRPPKE